MPTETVTISAPWRAEGGVIPVPGDLRESVRQGVISILSTRNGERPNRFEYGAALWDFIFEPVNDFTRMRIRDNVRQALAINEPRIRITSIRVEPVSQAGKKGYVLEVDYAFAGLTETVQLDFVPE